VGRRFLAASEGVVDQIGEIAKRENFTLFGLVNETLEQAVRADRFGTSLSDIVDEYSIFQMAKESGFILVSEGLFYQVLDWVFEEKRESLEKLWYIFGQWFGKYHCAKFPQEDQLRMFEKVMKTLTWEASEFSLTQSTDSVNLRVIAPRFPLSHSILLSSFFKGIMQTFGLSSSRNEISPGVIFLSFVREREALERAP